jgi:hypothetical protein
MTIERKTTHTPGPWKAIGGAVKGADGKYLHVSQYQGYDERGEHYEQRKANARLIAAAPELYEACVLAYRHSKTGTVQDFLAKAIAKAEGNNGHS